jgi:NAD(P)-dependent dehydrogenase (short-subunit alcohol dehydrogenase family)
MNTEHRYAILGGTSGIGLAVAKILTERGDRVVIGGRSASKLENALAKLGPNASGTTVDITDRASLHRFFSHRAPFVGVFTPAASYATGPFVDGSLETSELLFKAKFWGQYWAVHAALPYLTPRASIVLMSGAASARPLGAAAYAACNSALEGLARGLAVELSPVRVNCLSPGTTDSELWRERPADQRDLAYTTWQKLSLIGRPASCDEQAMAAVFLLDNGNMTGSTLFCDGGYTFR